MCSADMAPRLTRLRVDVRADRYNVGRNGRCRWLLLRAARQRELSARRPHPADVALGVALVAFLLYLDAATLGLTGAVVPGDLATIWLPNLTYLGCAYVCLVAGLREPGRPFYVVLAAAMGLWTAGNLFYYVFVADAGAGASVADALYLGFYPLAFAALVGEARHHREGGLPGHGLLDGTLAACLLGGLGITFVLAPFIADERVMAGNPAAVAYMAGDMLMACLIVGVFAASGWVAGRWLLCLTAGFVLFGIGDVLYLFQVTGGTLVDGSALHLTYTGGMLLMALSVRLPRRAAISESQVPTWSALVWPSVFSAGSALLLAYGSHDPLPTLAAVLALCTVAGGIVRAGMTFRDARKLFDSHREARTDPLTGLANRRRFFSDLKTALAEARGGAGGVALLVVDLDRFKELNDSLGHHAGDALLREIGPRLRRAAGDAPTLARLGGDEFAVILRPADGAEELACRIRVELERPFAVQGLPIAVEASIGVALHPQHGTDSEHLLRCADVAMYRAKSSHAGVAVYDVEDDQHSPDRVRLMAELREGIPAGQLVVHYQPKVALADGRVIGVEALVRWQHPERGLLGPGLFLPATEQTALLRPLTLSVLEQALDQAARWQAAGSPLQVAVNLSAANLLDAGLAATVDEQLVSRGLPASALRLEITESTVMADPQRAGVVLAALHDLGIGLTLDDFGTGYSSLAYLRELPVDEMKIDKSFVLDLLDSRENHVILDATTRLARGLELHVVAEGVEDEATFRELGSLGCDSVQGFLIARPLPAAELERRLARAGDTWWWPEHPRFVQTRQDAVQA